LLSCFDSFIFPYRTFFYKNTRFFLLSLLCLKVVKWMSEPLFMTTRKNPLFLRVNTQNLKKTAGSSDKDSESEYPSESTQSVSPPPAASPENRKRMRKNDEEDSGASKPAAPAAKESSPEDDEAVDPYTMTGAVSS
jgi:hypothetical protein